MVEGKKPSDLPFICHYTPAWKELQKEYEKLPKHIGKDETKWIFRANEPRKREDHKKLDKSKNYSVKGNYFQTSLDKAFDRFLDEEGKRYARKDLEVALIGEFQRKAHPHLMYLPDSKNIIEWLTLMQHYGAPTRLLDWTYSFYIALFFALTRLDCDKEYAEVWAVDSKWIGEKEKEVFKTKKLKQLRELRKKDPINYMDEYHNEILKHLFKYPKPLVLVLNSFRLNDRLIAQQGTFLVQGNVDESFDDNIRGLGKEYLHRIVIDVNLKERNNILKELDKMNINSAALFPGLQGFAESLVAQLANPGRFGIVKARQ